MVIGLLIVEVEIGVAVVVVVVVVVILLPDFIQLQITSNGNKTVNIYVKKLFKKFFKKQLTAFFLCSIRIL